MRGARTLALSVVAVATLVAPLGGIAAAGQGNGGSGGGSGGSTQGVATLKVERPAVEVKAKGADDFEPATDGQQLRAGDTVRTDATGRAEIDYSAGSYTRLDVNTTFKIVKLTENQGQRQVEGGLESGRTWNRAEDVTESGSFEQSGGGATAAVTGTAFAVECTSLSDCTYMAIVDVTDLTGKDGEKRTLTPLTECDSDDGALCDEVSDLTPEEIAANAWIQENLLRDLLERGFGPGPFVVGGTLVIQDGVITFTENPTPPPPASTTTTTTQPKPTVADPPLDCEVDFGEGYESCDYAAPVVDELQPASEIVVYENDLVVFKVRIVNNGAPGPLYVVFDQIPSNTGDFCTEENYEYYGCEEPLQTDFRYGIDQVFIFEASYCEEGCPSGTLRFHVENDQAESAIVDVPISVEFFDYCSEDVVGACGAESASVNAAPPTTTAPTTTPPTTASSSPPSSTPSTRAPEDGGTTTTSLPG